MPEIFIIATRNCTHAPNLKRELADLGHDCEIKYVEDHPELVDRFQIRHSPNLVIDDEVVFRHQPTESELRAALASRESG